MDIRRDDRKRWRLRRQFFTGKLRNDSGRKVDKQRLASKGADYVKLNFKLPVPGPSKAFEELQMMLKLRQTPEFYGRKYKGDTAYIPPRPLGFLELKELRNVLLHQRSHAECAYLKQRVIDLEAENAKLKVEAEIAKLKDDK